ncbi:hypothetical protein G1E_33690 [Pseudomonas sp. TJI-51]|jgi:hypothetical protein|nr:hypothetical protein G1E_33690 [Pseudomonas sp. TJI-51]
MTFGYVLYRRLLFLINAIVPSLFSGLTAAVGVFLQRIANDALEKGGQTEVLIGAAGVDAWLPKKSFGMAGSSWVVSTRLIRRSL